MSDAASRTSPPSGPANRGTANRGHALALPNLLTYARCVAVPLVAGCLFWSDILHGGLWLRWVALGLYAAAAITDFFDGYLARAWQQQSAIGRMLDPIADKLLVSTCLLMLASDGTIRGWSLWAAVVILCREILVSGLREFLAELRVSVPVSRLAKWKTTLQLVAVGVLITGQAGEQLLPGLNLAGIVLLWISAVLTLYTGYDYFRAGARHLVEDQG
ncbi:CDP-diacylglycerol--glycerol-3-phosphate 3-phosphatidyltransferase [Xanthobacter sp. TB0139]|uniref:CDP-diacylglycerol--glycerol-3-phosphate 3-phosphatidyltransferase n=1 Tax=Xanthobacter sp. TB0139 TaxID=3459178 RepID=UPI00403A49BF